MFQQLDEYITKGWIKPSVSPYRPLILFVHKKEGIFQMCIEFRMLNKQTKIDAYPVPGLMRY